MKKFAYVFFSILYLEFIFKLLIFKNITDVIYVIIMSLLLSLFIYLISSFFNKKLNTVFLFVSMFMLFVLFSLQYVYYGLFNSFFTLKMLRIGTDIFEFWDVIVNLVIKNFLILLFLFPFILLFFLKKRFSFERMNFKNFLILSTIIISIYLVNILYLNVVNNERYSYKQLYFKLNYPNLSVKKLGVITSFRIDLQRFIFGFEEEEELEVIEKEEIIKETLYNKMDIDFDIEGSSELVKLNNYFKNTSPSNQNEYTGIFEDYNLVFIVAESFYHIAVDKDRTPILYELVNNGFVFNNFYSVYGNTTDGEFSALSSLIPIAGEYGMQKAANNYLPFVLGNVFKKADYVTTGFHNHLGSYYNRHKTIPAFGFDFYACGNGLNINCKLWPQSDLEMVDVSYDKYIDNDKFLTYYMTVSGHLNYTFTGNMMAYKNREIVSELSYSEPIRAYLACNYELEKALESLMNKLEEKNILDNTVIVMLADHWPYQLKPNEINEISEYKVSTPFDLYKNNLVIYNSKMGRVEVDKYMDSLDVLPTVLNLFNIEYDSRLLMGNDAFSDKEGLVIFPNRSFITNKIKYDSVKHEYVYLEEVDDDYIDMIKKEVADKFYLSSKIVGLDYYKYIIK